MGCYVKNKEGGLKGTWAKRVYAKMQGMCEHYEKDARDIWALANPGYQNEIWSSNRKTLGLVFLGRGDMGFVPLP